MRSHVQGKLPTSNFPLHKPHNPLKTTKTNKVRYLILVIFLLLFDSFIFRTFAPLAANWSVPLRYIATITYWLFPVALLGLMALAGKREQKILTLSQFIIFRATIMIAYISKLLVALVLGINGLIYLISTGIALLIGQEIPYDSSWWMLRIAFTIGLFVFSILVYGMLRNRYRYKVFREVVEIPGLPDVLKGFKIVQISDIHAGSLTDKAGIQKGIDLINKEAADLICFTGDLVNNVAAEMDGFVNVFKQIKATYGTYSVLGNHDYGDYVRWPDQASKMLNFKQIIEVHRALGWELLLNENRMINVKGKEIAIIGVENYSAHPRFSRYGDMEKAVDGLGEADLKLLLSHDPSHWDDDVRVNYPDIDLTMSGHTHGGQFGIEMGKLKWSPVSHYYRQWIGLYREGTQYLYINRGFGFLGYPGRVGILPEITVLELA